MALRPIIRAARERLAASHPMAVAVTTAVANGLRAAQADPASSVQQVDAPTVAAVAQAVVPVITNATNQEPWYQSRVKVGLMIGFVGWVMRLFGWDLGLDEADKELLTNVLMAFGGGMAGAGRWFNGLPPMRWNPLTWFGLRK